MSLSNLGLNASNVTALFFLIGGLLTVLFAVSVALGVINAASFYSMAHKQNLKNKWFGFVPFFKSIIRGNLASDRNSSVLGKISLTLSIVLALLGLCTAGAFVSSAIQVVFAADSAVLAGLDSISFDTIPTIAFANVLLDVFASVALVKYVFDAFCNFLIYKRYAEKTAVVYTVIGVVLPILTPIFMFCVRPKSTTFDE